MTDAPPGYLPVTGYRISILASHRLFHCERYDETQPYMS